MYALGVLPRRCGHSGFRLLRGSKLSITARIVVAALVGCQALFSSFTIAQAVELGEVDLTVIDAVTKEPIAARLRIQDSRGRAPRIRNVPRLGNDFAFRNMLTFKLRTGRYQFTIDRGPHYKQRVGHLEVNRDGFDQKTVTLPRFANMRSVGYYGGDLLMTRDREDVEVLMDAEELDLVTIPTWEPGVAFSKIAAKRNRSVEIGENKAIRDFTGAVADTPDGRYLAANLKTSINPLAYGTDAFGFATAVKATESAHLAVLDPWAWDMPMLAAHDLVDSIAILGDALQLDGDLDKLKKGRRSDDSRFTGQHGAGRYAESIYYHLLNCGLRIAPSAFSNSGDTKNPPGFNRVYVACGQDFAPASWWRNLEAGRSILSNGPVLRVRANERLPGTVFLADQELKLEITCDLATRQKVEYLEIIKNGRTLESVRLDKWAAAGGHLPIITFKESGWLLVRAYAPSEPNFRCAFSAPFFVEIGGRNHVSRDSAKFFKDWVFERAKMLRKSGLPKAELQQRIKQQKKAYDFWQALEAEGK